MALWSKLIKTHLITLPVMTQQILRFKFSSCWFDRNIPVSLSRNLSFRNNKVVLQKQLSWRKLPVIGRNHELLLLRKLLQLSRISPLSQHPSSCLNIVPLFTYQINVLGQAPKMTQLFFCCKMKHQMSPHLSLLLSLSVWATFYSSYRMLKIPFSEQNLLKNVLRYFFLPLLSMTIVFKANFHWVFEKMWTNGFWSHDRNVT